MLKRRKIKPIYLVALRFSLIGIALSISLFFLIYAMGRNPISDGKMFDIIMFPIIIFFSLKEFRDFRNKGELRFWQGLTLGFMKTFIIAIASANFIYAFTQWISPEVLEEYRESRYILFTENKETLIEDLNEGNYNRILAEINQISTADVALDDFYKKMLIGFFVTIIISVTLRR